jgi:putative SOS response-associated peptidase YedK
VGSLESSSGQVVKSCSIRTTAANELLDEVHDRMPLILPQRPYQIWLTAPATEAQRLAELLVPFDVGFMRRYALSCLVNKPQNELPAGALEVPNPETQALAVVFRVQNKTPQDSVSSLRGVC